ncbi:MAG: hypothetical protein MR416_05160 [Lachnospiraceae bacterium]|nr:hypothetical protein [Lachnospiraceae bacterium]MDD7023319.1 hypothetical protein [Oscillospiraceae bacterium]MDY5540399.1 hypothetical protein [Lachnospiraceae bacterium]
MIIIQPSGGLCNRIRSINSAMTLAKKKGLPLKVLWLNAPELNCPFESLFQPTKEFELINIYSLKSPKKLFLQFTAKQRFNNEDILNNKTGVTLNEDFYRKLSDSVYIFTWEQFYPTEDYHLFRPTQEIQAKIDAFTDRFAPHMVGVHIRRTDNVSAIGKSGTEAFIRAMEAEIAADPDVKFFLATDERKEEDLLREHFGNRIISNEHRVLDRNSIEGMHDAMIDLYCLAATDKILGSFWSSFTDVAAQMRGIEKVIVGEEE